MIFLIRACRSSASRRCRNHSALLDFFFLPRLVGRRPIRLVAFWVRLALVGVFGRAGVSSNNPMFYSQSELQFFPILCVEAEAFNNFESEPRSGFYFILVELFPKVENSPPISFAFFYV